MAIDANIALQNTPAVQFDPVGSMTKGMNLRILGMQPDVIAQQLASARAAEEATRQGTAALVQKTAEEKRAIDASKALADIGKRYTQIDSKTGKVNINRQGWLHEALTAGVPFEQVGKLAETVYKQTESELSDDKSRQDFVQNQLFVADNLVRGLNDPAQAQAVIGQLGKRIASIVGPEVAIDELNARYGADPSQFITRADMNARTSISPAQAEQFKISKEQLAQGWTGLSQAQQSIVQAGAANLTSPEAMSAGSPVSAAYRDLAVKSGIPAAQVQNLSAAQIHRIPGFSTQIEQNIVPGSTRSTAALGAVGSQVQADFYDKLGSAAAKLAKDAKYAELIPKNILENKLGRFAGDPNINEYITLVREAQAKGLPIDENQGPSSISQTSAGQAKLLRTAAGRQENLSTKPTFTSPAAAPAAPTSSRVPVIIAKDSALGKAGSTVFMDAAQVERAVAAGWVTRGPK